jgi:titin
VTWTALGATQPTVARTAAQATSVNTAVTYSDATALVNVAYTYRVRSVNATAVLQSAWTVSAPAILTVAAPTTLTAALGVATKTTQPVALSWIDNANNETAYQVQRAPVTAGVVGTYAVVGTVTRTAAQKTAIAAAVAYTDATGLINTTYAYQVVAVSGTALSQPSNVAQVTTSGAATTTSAPGTLTANTASGVSIALSWIDNSTTETGFNVMRSTDNVTFTQVGATLTRTAAQTKATGTATTYTDTTAAIGTTYYYRVDAVIPVAATATTAAGTTTVPSSVITAALAIAAPTTVSATVPAGTGNVLVSWTDTSNNESGFEVDRIDPLGAKVTFAVARTAAQKTSVNTVVSYTDTTALPGTSYTYVVRAVNLTGTVRAVSADVTAAPVPVPTPPMIAPTSVSAVVASASSIKLSWIDMSTNETGFLVERSTDNGVTWGKLASLAAARTAAQGKAVNAAVSYTDTLVAPVVQGTYVYRVSAVQHTGTGATAVITAQSAATQGNPVSFIAPAAPTLLTAAAGTTAGTVNLAWTVNSTNETGFTVQYSTTATFTAPVTVAIASPAVSSVTVSGLTSKTGYFFRIAAKNLVGTSAYASTTVAVVAP